MFDTNQLTTCSVYETWQFRVKDTRFCKGFLSHVLRIGNETIHTSKSYNNDNNNNNNNNNL